MPKSKTKSTTRGLRHLIGTTILALFSFAAWAETHPLDPLTADEIKRAVAIISNTGRVGPETRASMITLNEPSKKEVLGWAPGQPANRAAFAVLKITGETYEAIVDLNGNAVISWTHIPDVQTAIQSEEWGQAQAAVKSNPAWREAMAARGYSSFDTIFCESLSAGYFGERSLEGRRVLKMPCYDVRDAQTNIYARPIEGLIAVVDLHSMEVIDVIDEDRVPVGTESYEFDEGSIANLNAPLRPIRTEAPLGWNFTVIERMVKWQDWQFHLGFDQRFGPIVSLVTHGTDNAPRLILYQGFVSEVFVPYMDSSRSWSFRTYLDAGEFGLGRLASPLAPGADCPENAVFFDATLSDYLARAVVRERVICVFERDPGRPLWRHYEALTSALESRPATELVIRSIPSVAHYDYVIDWIFSLGGEIRVEIGATGIDAVKALQASEANENQNKRLGAKVTPRLQAVNHDHFFSVRLDIDIDQQTNRFVTEKFETIVLPEGNPRRSLWQVVPEPLKAEAALSAGDGTGLWRIENQDVTTRLGRHPAYQIQTDAPTALLTPDDWPQRRASFSSADLWVTKRRAGELFAAGPYPNQSPGEKGIAAYADGEDVSAGDLVVWATVGFRHVTRPEDWPVMTALWRSIILRPYGFFDQNPALGVRRKFLDETD